MSPEHTCLSVLCNYNVHVHNACCTCTCTYVSHAHAHIVWSVKFVSKYMRVCYMSIEVVGSFTHTPQAVLGACKLGEYT